jgi:hypothetical protein
VDYNGDDDEQTLGIENEDGTNASVAPGKNRAIWSTTNYYVAFIPDCDFESWTNDQDATVLLDSCVKVAPAVTTTYYGNTSCGLSPCPIIIYVPNADTVSLVAGGQTFAVCEGAIGLVPVISGNTDDTVKLGYDFILVDQSGNIVDIQAGTPPSPGTVFDLSAVVLFPGDSLFIYGISYDKANPYDGGATSLGGVLTGGGCFDLGNNPGEYVVITVGSSSGYCCVTGTNSNFFIDQVRLAYPQSNTVTLVQSGADPDGYGDYRVPSGNISASYVPFVYFNIKPGNNRIMYIRVWVDWNKNGVFDPFEVVAQRRTNNAWNGQFTVPGLLRSVPEDYSVRIVASGRGYVNDPCGELARAEAEDYVICIANGCGAPPAPLLDLTDNGISNVEQGISNIEIKPNPFNGLLRVEVGLNDLSDVEIKLFDQRGKLMISQSHFGSAGMNQFDINTQSMADGMYYVHIKTADGTTIRKMVKTGVTSRP